MSKPYHLTPGASQGNAFTAWMDGAKSCMAPTSCAAHAHAMMKRARTSPTPRQNITLDKDPDASRAKRARLLRAGNGALST